MRKTSEALKDADRMTFKV